MNSIQKYTDSNSFSNNYTWLYRLDSTLPPPLAYTTIKQSTRTLEVHKTIIICVLIIVIILMRTAVCVDTYVYAYTLKHTHVLWEVYIKYIHECVRMTIGNLTQVKDVSLFLLRLGNGVRPTCGTSWRTSVLFTALLVYVDIFVWVPKYLLYL